MCGVVVRPRRSIRGALSFDARPPSMFLISSTGRCGTLALTRCLSDSSDHEVAHEPEPLLREAWLKHHAMPYMTQSFLDRMAFYGRAASSGISYGESFRTPNLLADVLAVAPTIPLLIIVRDPEGYVRSAHSRGVLGKGDLWDEYRLMPAEYDLAAPLALRIALHWQTVNRYLLDVAAQHDLTRVVLHQPLDPVIDDLCEFVGVQITDRENLRAGLASRPNQATTHDDPEGFQDVKALCRPLWEEVLDRAVGGRSSVR